MKILYMQRTVNYILSKEPKFFDEVKPKKTKEINNEKYFIL
jgi:hypothetical protein